MTHLNRTQLIELGAEQLAGTLLELYDMYPAVAGVVERLLATPDENIKRYKTKLANLKRSRRFIPWQLQQLLVNLERGVKEPCTGVELVGRFFEADASIFNRCDDSNGSVGDVFSFSATDLFVSFAIRCAY